MSAFDKIDEKLLTAIALNEKDRSAVECIIFAKNFGYAKKNLIKKDFIKVIKEFPFISAIGIKIYKEDIIKIAAFSYVDFVSSVAKVTSMMDKSRDILKVETLHRAGLLGRGVGICYIDTGLYGHFDFCLGTNRIEKFVDLVNNRKNPYDDNGHGTCVVGAGSGSGLMSNGRYSGIAPCSRIFSVKALNEKGETGAMQILQAMEWVYDNYQKYNIKIVCMSFGSEPIGVLDPILQGAETLWNSGVMVVAAAGNSGPALSSIKSPAVSKKIITVGGLDDGRNEKGDFKIAAFSSRGPAFGKVKPDVIAPSVGIKTCSINFKNPYCEMTGTSVATPMIAGLAALILEKNPRLSPDTVKNIIISNSKPIIFSKMEEGFGLPSAETCFIIPK